MDSDYHTSETVLGEWEVADGACRGDCDLEWNQYNKHDILMKKDPRMRIFFINPIQRHYLKPEKQNTGKERA